MSNARGPVELVRSTEPLELDVEVSYAGSYWTVNDHVHYRVTTDGWGVVEQTHRRKEVTSEWFEGTFVTHKVRDSTKRSIEVMVRGADQPEVTENVLQLIDWFTQDSFNIRITLDDHVETWLCSAADYRIDRSHVLLHNRMAKVNFTMSVNPRVTYEVAL